MRRLSAILVGLILLSGIALAEPGRGRHHQHLRQQMMKERMEALDLTSAQKEQMKTRRAEGQKQMAKLQAEVKVARIELRETMRKAASKQADVRKAVDQLNAARSKMTSARVDHLWKMRNVLSDEQREKLGEMGLPHRGGGPPMWRRRGMGPRGAPGTTDTRSRHR